MHYPEEQAWDRDDLLEEITFQNVEDHRTGRPRATLSLVIRHPDLSAPVSIGPYDLPKGLGHILQAIEENFPRFLRAMEARVPDSRSAPLSPTDFWSSLFSEVMVVEVMVSDRENGG